MIVLHEDDGVVAVGLLDDDIGEALVDRDVSAQSRSRNVGPDECDMA